MLNRTPEQAIELIENERAIVRVLRSDPSDFSDLAFEFLQFADPENVRPVRPLTPNADRNYIYNQEQKDFVRRQLKRPERGLPQPGNLRIKAVSGTLLPADGIMRLYDHAKINQDHYHVLYGVDAGADPDRYLYKHKHDSTIDVSKEPCLIVACFAHDAGTNTKWHIKGQPLNEYHEGRYPEALTFAALREHNRAFVSKRDPSIRHKDERNEVKFKPSVESIHFVGAVSENLTDRVNALHFKFLILNMLKIDLPVVIFTDNGKQLYTEDQHVKDILIGFARGVLFAYDLHDMAKTHSHPMLKKYREMYLSYSQYVKQNRLFHGVKNLDNFFAFYESKLKVTEEDKQPHVQEMKNAAKGRKLWSDIVSQTYHYHANNPCGNSLVLEKLEKAGITGDRQAIYHDMCAYLQQNTKLVIAFQAHELMQEVPVSFGYLNLSEMDAEGLQSNRKTHLKERQNVEDITFSYLPGVKEQFAEFIQARPRYAYLTFMDKDNYPEPLTTNFGLSYFVLKDVLKLNSLFVPRNAVTHFKPETLPATPCTYFDFGALLHQADDSLLLGLAHAVTGQLPSNKISNDCSYEMHAYIPPVELFDKNCVERLYVSPDEYKMSKPEIRFLEEQGFVVSHEGEHAYAKEEERFLTAIAAKDVSTARDYLKRFPFLNAMFDKAIKQGDVETYHFFLQHLPGYEPLSWQRMLSKVPLHKLDLFHPIWSEAELKKFDSNDLVTLTKFISKVFNENQDGGACTLFLSWLKQFNAAKVNVDRFESSRKLNMLLGTMLASFQFQELAQRHNGYSHILIALIDSALLPTGLVAVNANRLFENPNLKTVAQHIIQNKHYILAGTAEEKQALIKGRHYAYILHDAGLVQSLSWNLQNSVDAASALIASFDDMSYIERGFLNLHAAGAFSDVPSQDKFKLMLQAADKDKRLIFVLAAVLYGPNLFADSALVFDLIEKLTILPGFEPCVRFLQNYSRPALSMVPEDKVHDEEVKTLFRHADQPLSTPIWQGLFYMAYGRSPGILRDQHCIELFLKKLPDFNFMMESADARFSLVCAQFYYPRLISTLIANPNTLSLSNLQTLVVHCMQPSIARYNDVKALIRFQPEVIQAEDKVTQNSLLHLALKAQHKDYDLIHRLMQSKLAANNNAKKESVLLLALRAVCCHHNRYESTPKELQHLVTEMLHKIKWSNAQLIQALNYFYSVKMDIQGYSQKICELLNENKAEDIALQDQFLESLLGSDDKRVDKLWRSYLYIRSMPTSYIEKAITHVLNSDKKLLTKYEMHALLERAPFYDCIAVVKFQFNRDRFNLFHVSHLLSHARCRIEDILIVDTVVSTFKMHILHNEKRVSDELYLEVVHNFLIFFEKSNVLDKLRKDSLLISMSLSRNKFTVVNLLMAYQFELSEGDWIRLITVFSKRPMTLSANEQQALEVIFNKNPSRIPGGIAGTREKPSNDIHLGLGLFGTSVNGTLTGETEASKKEGEKKGSSRPLTQLGRIKSDGSRVDLTPFF